MVARDGIEPPPAFADPQQQALSTTYSRGRLPKCLAIRAGYVGSLRACKVLAVAETSTHKSQHSYAISSICPRNRTRVRTYHAARSSRRIGRYGRLAHGRRSWIQILCLALGARQSSGPNG